MGAELGGLYLASGALFGASKYEHADLNAKLNVTKPSCHSPNPDALNRPALRPRHHHGFRRDENGSTLLQYSASTLSQSQARRNHRTGGQGLRKSEIRAIGARHGAGRIPSCRQFGPFCTSASERDTCTSGYPIRHEEGGCQPRRTRLLGFASGPQLRVHGAGLAGSLMLDKQLSRTHLPPPGAGLPSTSSRDEENQWPKRGCKNEQDLQGLGGRSCRAPEPVDLRAVREFREEPETGFRDRSIRRSAVPDGCGMPRDNQPTGNPRHCRAAADPCQRTREGFTPNRIKPNSHHVPSVLLNFSPRPYKP